MNRFYFAYGSNMDPEQMAIRVPWTDPQQSRAGRLNGWRLTFDKEALAGAGYANIVECDGDQVEGTVWTIDAEGLGELDGFEGEGSHYLRRPLEIETSDGPVLCVAYVAHPDRRRVGLRPERDYLERLLAGRFLSPQYLHRLREIETA